MSKTTRWWQKPHTQFRMRWRPEDSKLNDPVWKQWNPRHCRHERKIMRVRLHRNTRRENKIRLKKGRDIEPETRTCGWLTH